MPEETCINDNMVAQLNQPPYLIHASVKDRLHPDYVAWYDKYLLNAQQAHYLPIDAARKHGGPPPAHREPLPVGMTLDLHVTRQESEGPRTPIRCFVPTGCAPKGGWPVVLYVSEVRLKVE
jgi:hypothetical protein